MSRRDSLLALAAYGRTVEEEFIAELPEAERLAVGAPDDWAAKDLVAHVTTWRDRRAAELADAGRAPLPPEDDEFDKANRHIFDQNRNLAWQVVHERARVAWDRFAAALAQLTDELLDTSETAAGSGRPLWRRITIDAGNHPVPHYAEYARRKGRVASATRWMESLTPRLSAVDPSDEWHGVIHYNLACHYAQVGMMEKALEALRLSLGRNPGLREWSSQDTDLTPLHPDPRFSSIVGSEAPTA